jgi:hypothetical protein
MSLAVGGALLLLLGLLVAMAPTLAGSLGRGLIEGRVAGAINGTASIRQLSLGWFGEQRLEGLAIRDASGQTAIDAAAMVDCGLLDLLLGRVDTLRVEVDGSVKARLRADGSTSLSNLAKAPATSAPSRPARAGGPVELPFAIRLTVKRLDFQLDDDAGVAMALRDLKGSVEVGRGRPLQADFTGTTQVRDQSGEVAVKVSLDDFLSQAGSPDLARMTGTAQASVRGFMLPMAGMQVQVQSASLSVQADASKPISVQAQSGVAIDGQPATVQVTLQAARPSGGAVVAAWAADPRTWTGSVGVRDFPTAALQRWLASTPIAAARDIGPSLDLSVQGGAGEAMLQLSAQHLQVKASAAVDASSGAVQGRDAEASIDLDPALLASMGVQVTAPGRLKATLARLATPPVGPAGLDVSAISFEGGVTIDPLTVTGVAPEPVQVAAAASFRTAALKDSVDLGLTATVQQQPIQASLQVSGLGATVDIGSARVQGTLSAGPLDPNLLPGVPADIRARLAKAGVGTSTIRASVAGGRDEGSGQLQVDTQAGTLAAKVAWDGSSLQVPEFRAGLLLQPALVQDLAGGQVTLTQPMPVQLTAGPARLARSGLKLDSASMATIPVNLLVSSIDLGPVSGVCDAASVRSLKAQGNLSPMAGALFDGTVSLEGASLTQVPQAGSVQASGLSVRGKVLASVSQLFTGTVSLADAMASAVDGVGPVQVKSVAAEATVPIDLAQAGQVHATVASVTCSRVQGLSAPVRADAITLTMDGPLVPAEGTSLSLDADLRDAAAVLARAKVQLRQQQGTQEIGLDLTQVDMRRALALMGNAKDMPDWVGTSGDRSLAARLRTGSGGMAFSVQASLDPIVLQAQGTRAVDGAVTLTKGSLQARLPAEVVKQLLATADPGLQVQSCQPMQGAVTVRSCTLPGDGQGGVRLVGKGADLDVTARLEPWALQLVDTPALAFGGADLAVVSRGGEQLRVDLKGSLAAGQSKSAPLEVQVTAAQGVGPDGAIRLDPDSLGLLISMQDFPTALVDRASGMDGYLLDMLGPVFSVNLSGRTGAGPEDVLQASLRSPTLSVKAPRVRFAQSTLSITPDAPVVASLQPDDRFRQRVMRPINPFFADLRTIEGRPIMATVQSLRMPVPVDTRSLDTAFTVEVGEVEMEKSDQFLALMDLAIASKGRTVPGLVSPLAGSVTAGVLTYRDFKVQVGRLGKSGWQQTLLSDARINLGSTPPMAEPITIRYPAGSVANLLSGIPGARGLLGKLNDALGSNGEKVGEMAQVAIDFTGPLDGGKLKETVRPEFDLPRGMGGNILKGAEKQIGDALDGLFGGGKK